LHKGGANNGLFLEITVDSDISLPIPDQKYTFNTLERAQALGDYEALCARNRRIMRIHFSSLDMLEKWITALIQ
jgi:transaldolase/glucose-6-phosphate isomerase